VADVFAISKEQVWGITWRLYDTQVRLLPGGRNAALQNPAIIT